MKLSATQIRTVEAQLGVKPVPEEHPVTADLKEAFGDHTFFLDAAGLNIVEPDPSPDVASANVVKVASWANDERNQLLGHQPETLAVTVDLSADQPEPPNTAA